MVSRSRKARRRRAERFHTDLVRPNEQVHQLRAIVRKMRVCSAARNYIASEIGTLRRAIFNVAYLGLRYAFVGWFNSQGDAGTRERDFP
jgi:hypothetical protein